MICDEQPFLRMTCPSTTGRNAPRTAHIHTEVYRETLCIKRMLSVWVFYYPFSLSLDGNIAADLLNTNKNE